MAVLANQSVPLDLNIVPVAPILVGNAAVDQMLAALLTDCKNLPVATGLANMLGTLAALEINTPPTTSVIWPITLVEDEYKIRLAVVVAGHVVVDHAGAALVPD